MSAAPNGPKRLGVFGGAFDPPHSAHRALAQAALEQLQLDALWVFPTGQAWHKARELSPARHRIAMAELAFSDLARVRVDARETVRGGPSYSVDTLRELHAEHPAAALFLILGQDQAQALPSWHEWQAVIQLATVCVAARAHCAPDTTRFLAPAGFEQRFLQLQFAPLPVSATGIRASAAAGQGVAPLVGAAVARYIVHHHLYQSA